ncbi:MAG: class F sortase [Actinomycetota bacterium]|nr:class F sortase [Actinomycetota bacterium]MDQ2957345.1 class F sortase [Actinomycetota bacterium]
MSEIPPIWTPHDDQPEPEPPASHRRTRGFPLIPAAFAAGGLVLGVLATLLISHTGSGKTHPVAAVAPSATSNSSVAGTKPASKAPSKKPSSSAPVVLPPATETGLTHEAPTVVQIPKIGVSSSLVSLGLAADGTLQVPSDYAKAGWYSQGAYPGDANEPPALIVGHVDDYRGPAVFFRLKQLGLGDKVLVTRTDGSTATFVIYKTENYLKTSFPAQSVYASTQRPEIRLITCTGQFDSNARSYLSNFVAYAYLVSGS